MLVIVIVFAVVSVASLIVTITRGRRIEQLEQRLGLVHWEACVLARFFEENGVEFNWRSMDELGPEHLEAFAKERPKYLCGEVHIMNVEMQATGEMNA